MHCQIISLHYYKDTFFMSHRDRFGMDCVHFLIHLCCFTAVLRVCYGRVQIQSPGTLPESKLILSIKSYLQIAGQWAFVCILKKFWLVCLVFFNCVQEMGKVNHISLYHQNILDFNYLWFDFYS